MCRERLPAANIELVRKQLLTAVEPRFSSALTGLQTTSERAMQ